MSMDIFIISFADVQRRVYVNESAFIGRHVDIDSHLDFHSSNKTQSFQLKIMNLFFACNDNSRK